MRRDPELIRKLILAIEVEPARVPEELSVEGYTKEEVGYHAYLMVDAGLVIATDLATRDRQWPWKGLILTVAGHDFADAARSDSVWNNVIAALKDKAVTGPISIIQAMLEQAVKGLFCL